jgi:hypothetical protein
MKAVVKQFKVPNKVRSYPYLGFYSHKNLYVLFSGPRKGVVVFDGSHTRLGEISEVWCEEDLFEYTNDIVTLSNE